MSTEPRLHVRVDGLICQGTGYCVRVAPTIFDLRDDRRAHVLDAHPPPDMEDLVEEAATLCPTRAITY